MIKVTSENNIKFGLPKEVVFCEKCVISNQRPNSCVEYQHTNSSKKETIYFDKNGVCDACRFSEKKTHTINWEERDQELKQLCDKYRKNNGQYDCLTPGSGGKDSFYAAHILKHKYGMNPLTVTWAPHMYTPWGWENFQSWINAGFDNYLCTPNAKTHRLLTRLALENLFHPFQPFMIGQKSFAPKMAELFGIQLIFYGENEAEYGNPQADTNTALRDTKYYTGDSQELYLGGVSTDILKKEYGLQEVDLNLYRPISRDALHKNGIQIHYLGYYLKWHPQSCYYYSVENSDFKASPVRTVGTYSKYNSIDDKIDDLHYYTTYIKFGIGRATYDAAQEIRSGDITREEGVQLIKKYDGEFPERFIEEIFDYLSINDTEFPAASKQFQDPIMSRESFENLTDRFRSPHLWFKDNEAWRLRRTVYDI
ncbi:MAG TPA: N-acetyl sugar amidotransferase [Gammaproteobacteria bacterium]|nr:N-acetyl sugar amidotransferase [Gammaproteobacteria bacterium]